jgi:hypothetical protein
LRDLDSINGAAKSTGYVFAISLIISVFMGSGGWALATGAAPTLPLSENYLKVFSLSIIFFSIIAFPIPLIFKWNWEAKYFGAGLIPFASGSILGLYPIFCITLYSSLPLLIRIAFLLLEVILIIHWCNRFTKIYRRIYNEKKLYNYIYAEDSTAVYYLQQADKKIITKQFKFQQFPSLKFCALSFISAFSLIPFATSLSNIIGLPFIHIFLAIGATPLNLMFLGLSTKMWLVYYFYPMRIHKETQKRVYVDMSSQPKDF